MSLKISGYYLDKQQQQIVEDQSKYLLVVAGAGSGKTLTILGKIKYLLDNKIKKEEILCISFTKSSSLNLKEKIKQEFDINMKVYTFHKLGLEIIKENNYKIIDKDVMSNIIHEFIYIDVINNIYFMKLILKCFKLKYKSKGKYLLFLEQQEDKIKQLEILVETFIHLFKCNNYKLSSFNVFLRKSKYNILNYKHIKTLLIIILNIYLKYEKYLINNNEIDFDDMIIKAIEKVKKDGIKRKYKYIIIDEYQDTSYIRLLLIKEIINKTNSQLMVVGDDFQSIYKFTGCDLSLFLNFKKHFKNSKILKIENTYRNSEQLINIAGSFVMKNKKQIRKKLKSNKTLNYPIQIIYYKNIKKTFKKLICKIYKETHNKILILGRNNRDINMILTNEYIVENNNIIYKKNKSIKLKYLTIHKSKGLEEENVIIINLEDKTLGFPSKIIDNKLLKYVSKNKEKYKFSEERRLFYVALTRTKNYAYLLTPERNESIFVKELIKDFKPQLKFVKKF